MAVSLGVSLGPVAAAGPDNAGKAASDTKAQAMMPPDAKAEQQAAAKGLALATFAGGCFWCTEADFRKVEGVVSVVSGYTGGHVANPTYEQVGHGGTGHVEAVQVTFDPKAVSYRYLLDYYWRHVDPLDGRGQFADRGASYRPVIFTHGETQRTEAEASRAALSASGRFQSPIAVAIEPASRFWPAEDYHQDYAQKHPWKYSYYRHGSGRDTRLDAVWGDEARGPKTKPSASNSGAGASTAPAAAGH